MYSFGMLLRWVPCRCTACHASTRELTIASSESSQSPLGSMDVYSGISSNRHKCTDQHGLNINRASNLVPSTISPLKLKTLTWSCLRRWHLKALHSEVQIT
ncbi:hypothetical protein BDR07DRAFT_252449 [Suillus spraguei]|nr:hypothetical protein BDR07DRAFT_252449 [Suillus spraguei]